MKTEKYYCDLCGMRFDTAEECREHERTHYTNWEEAEDRLTYYEVETGSPEAWRSDIEKCIIEKILDEDIRKAKARENK